MAPNEITRTVMRKRITLPNGGKVDIPVISQIAFLDATERAQETQFTVDNTTQGDRDVHIASIPGDGAGTDETGAANGLKVERVDLWRVLDGTERAQETFLAPDSKTVNEPPQAPPYFITHEKTHIVKYINSPDDGKWIKSELIDEMRVLDATERAQETFFKLQNPPDNDSIDGLTLGTDGDGIPTIAIDPGIAAIDDALDPVRTDPFQNLVDFSEGEPSTGEDAGRVTLGGTFIATPPGGGWPNSGPGIIFQMIWSNDGIPPAFASAVITPPNGTVVAVDQPDAFAAGPGNPNWNPANDPYFYQFQVVVTPAGGPVFTATWLAATILAFGGGTNPLAGTGTATFPTTITSTGGIIYDYESSTFGTSSTDPWLARVSVTYKARPH